MKWTVFPILGVALLVALLSMVVGMLLVGCKADPPGKAETAIMNWAEHKILVHNKRQMNTSKDNPAAVADGKDAFSHYCVACHGLDGQKTGVPFADRMSPPVPSLAE